MKLAYIASAPGSGSTAFAQCLNSHPDVLALSEFGLLLHNDKSFHERLERTKLAPFATGVLRRPQFAEHRVRRSVGRLGGGGPGDRVAVAKVLASMTKRKRHVQVVIDKHPSLTPFFPCMSDRWPDMPMFHLVRDPMASVWSICRKWADVSDEEDRLRGPGFAWGPLLIRKALNSPLHIRAAMQVAGCFAAMSKRPAVLLSYERWLESPIDEMNAVYEVMGLPPLSPDAELVSPPSTRGTGNWREEMPAQAQADAQAVLRTWSGYWPGLTRQDPGWERHARR